MKRLLRSRTFAWMPASGLLLVWGCATQQPAQQVVDARRTYAEVSDGQAQKYAPDELLEADNLLTRAENAKNGSKEQIHLAYLADRQARLARSSGTIEAYQTEGESAREQYIEGLENRSSSVQERLDATREELSEVAEKMNEKDANVEQLEQRKAELEKRKGELEAQLDQKETALNEAEARAQAAMESLRQMAKVQEDKNETVITLSGSVLFESGKSKLLPIAEDSLQKVADAIEGLDDGKEIVIEGHTDSQGQDAMNQKLSLERAEAVRDYLAQNGVEKSRMQAVGKGETEPVAKNDSPEGRANNRRVELHISSGPEGQKAAEQTRPSAGAEPEAS